MTDCLCWEAALPWAAGAVGASDREQAGLTCCQALRAPTDEVLEALGLSQGRAALPGCSLCSVGRVVSLGRGSAELSSSSRTLLFSEGVFRFP